MTELQRNPERVMEYKQRAKELVAQMTLDEKIHQMLHVAPAIERLGIPAYNWWNEALHGVARAGTATVFPQAIGLAATFDEDLLERIADAIALEARAKYNMQQEFGDTDIYKGLTFWAPNVNIFRDPRWGRGHETYGEDPYLTSRLGVRFIKGLQGDDENYLKTAACAKHFAVHSGPEGLRHSFNAIASKQDMYETYLPAFQACVQEADVEAVMGAYNRTNGEPCCGSETLLVEILRRDWGFDGHIVSDCWAIKDFHEFHKVTANAVESVALAVNKGCDLNCGSLFVFLKDAIKQGLVTEDKIDQAVTRLMTTRMKLGMFDAPEKVPYNTISYTEVDSPKMREFNLQIARASLTLLKNENNFLPLDKNKLKTVGVIGPNANNRRALVGNYEGTASRYITPLEGIQDYLGDDVRVLYSEGCDLFKEKMTNLSAGDDRIAEVKGVCKESDVVIVCLGLDAGLEGEEGDTGNQFASGDKPDLRFPGIQEQILQVAYESGKPVILLVLTGSAMDLSWADERLPAIMQCWYPGAQGGRAIAEVLFGEYSPQGKLPVTFYRSTEELPEFTDYSMKGRTYRYMTQEALYPFGFGLSYSDFVISNVEANTDLVTDAGIEVTATIRNNGPMAGGETVQVYVKAEREDTPNAQLKGLKKVQLAPQEEQQVTLHLPVDAFGLFDEEAIKRVYAGQFSIYVGTSQPDSRSRALTGKEPVKLTLTAKQEIVLS